MKNLKKTKINLSLIFTWLVFWIIFILWIIYFSLRYFNTSYIEKNDFNNWVKIFETVFKQEIIKNNNFLETIFKQEKEFNRNLTKEKFTPWKDDRWWPGWFRFLNFVITNNSWEVVYDNIKENFELSINLNTLELNKLYKINSVLVKKIDVSIWEYKNIYFFKKEMYSFENYIEDILYFSIINIFCSIFFYLIWYLFVNKNLAPVEEVLNDMWDFIHNANHELKTPIAVISSNLQMLKAMKNYEEDLVWDSIWEIKRIDNLITWLSELSNITPETNIEEINLNTEINECINELKSQIEEKNLIIDFRETDIVIKQINKQYFYIMFSNLLRNAIKYNINKWFINIVLEKNKLIISNSWETIKAPDLDKIWDRFYKCDTSRSSEWFGIWLSLVKRITQIYKWKISVKSSENITTFEIVF